MKYFKILAADTNHYKSLIRDYRKDMNIITYTETLTELEDIEQKEMVVIYNRSKLNKAELKILFG
jgi:hypothetical protein